MFELNKDFLEGLGVGDMPEAEMQAFLAHLQEEMEVRVGERMSAGMSDAQIDEFDRVIDGDQETVSRILLSVENYKENANYLRMKDVSGLPDGDQRLLSEYASMVWLDKNCPQYADIVQQVITELKDEIKSKKDLI